jgi:hypothetical protein
VKGPAVELDDDALLAPDGIDLESLHLGVYLRLGKPRRVDELQELHLEVAADDLRSGVSRLEYSSDRAAALTARIAAKEVEERELVP